MVIEDKLYKYLKFYYSSPKLIRNLSGKLYSKLPLSFRYGATYKYYSKLLKTSPYFSSEQKSNYTIENLKNTFINAFENTKYYNELFQEVNFDPYGFNNLNQIMKIPLSDKDTLRKNKKSIINHIIPKSKLLYTTTGGTSGVPVEVYYVKGRERSREIAFIQNLWNRIGYKEGDKIIRLRGNVVDQGEDIFHKYEPIKNRLLLSTYDMHEENFEKYTRLITEFKPKFIHAYPSSISPLAKFCKEKNIQLPKLKGILCSSEQFYPSQRELIEEVFSTRVFSFYGHTEATTLAGECETSNNYHLFFEYGYTELIDENKNVITKPGQLGEIVGTSYEMIGFPIIRYKTGDFAMYADNMCSCGRNYTIISNLKGRRLQEQIISNKGHGISLTALNMHSDIFDNVIQYQFYQKEIGKVQLRIVKGITFSIQDEQKIRKVFKLKLKDLVRLDISYVNRINPTKNGKHKYLVQELN